MTYEEIWQKLKKMRQRDRKQLAYEMTHKGFIIGYVHPHYRCNGSCKISHPTDGR